MNKKYSYTSIPDSNRKSDQVALDGSLEIDPPYTPIMFRELFLPSEASSLYCYGQIYGKESACNAGDLGSIPGWGRSPGEGNGYPLQYSCLENPHGQRSLEGYSPWDRKELDTTERLTLSLSSEFGRMLSV